MPQQHKTWLVKAENEIKRIKKMIRTSEKRGLLKGMLLTRAVDNALKHMFLAGEITYKNVGFQGKGFRSLGQEAIYGAPYKLRTGPLYLDNGTYTGDIAAPLIRDLGVFLAMSGDDVATALNAQAGKIKKPCEGRDLHLGDFKKGILVPAAPLALATCTLVGLALTFKRQKQPRIAISFIGEGGSSLGEWHEAINTAAVLELPMIFCIQNNQTALSTPVHMQSKAQTFADKALGYGINALVVDGNDIEAITASFSFAAEEARNGRGPILLELITMRMCGHAHHDDMLYLGQDPLLSFDIPPLKGQGYVDQQRYEIWRQKDPIKIYEQQLIGEGVVSENDIMTFKQEALDTIKEALASVKSRSWPRFRGSDQELVFKNPWIYKKRPSSLPHYTTDGITYLQALALGIKESFLRHKNCLVIGEDVALPYGNAFMMFKTISPEYAERFINTPISENAIIGACVGLAMGGMLPIGEIQFNDFVACSMNQVANNVAKSYFRTGINLPLVVRLPYGGLRRAGPFHSQDTSPWFYRTPGLKIMTPSTPIDAMLMLQKAVNDPDPVLFYEHIALYRDPKIKQALAELSATDIEGAQYMRHGDDLTIVSYGAYVHVATRVAEQLSSRHHKQTSVIDLRYLSPLDFATLYESVKRTGRLLLVSEDCRTGSILESIASTIGEELFRYLDAPIKVLGSRNTPVPYAPSLEDDYLISEEQIIDAAMQLLSF